MGRRPQQLAPILPRQGSSQQPPLRDAVGSLPGAEDEWSLAAPHDHAWGHKLLVGRIVFLKLIFG